MHSIERFRGEHYFLSNMYPLPQGVVVLPEEVIVPTSEHGYMTDKFTEEYARRAIIEARHDTDPAKHGIIAKQLAKTLKDAGAIVRPDWNNAKIGVMTGYVGQKFDRDVDLAARLVATGDAELYEGNPWRDKFWGVSPVGSRNGHNHLGRILMEKRADIIDKINQTRAS